MLLMCEDCTRSVFRLTKLCFSVLDKLSIVSDDEENNRMNYSFLLYFGKPIYVESSIEEISDFTFLFYIKSLSYSLSLVHKRNLNTFYFDLSKITG